MKKILLGILILVSTFSYSQDKIEADSLKLRVLNDGKYYIKELRIIVDGVIYFVEDIEKRKYSDFITLPYIWNYSNPMSITLIINKSGFDYLKKVSESPIDHIGEQKIESGLYTLKVKTQLKKRHLYIERDLIKE